MKYIFKKFRNVLSLGYRTFSFWALVTYVIFLFWLYFPLTGFIFAVVTQGNHYFISGVLLNILFLVIFIEAFFNRIPRYFLLIPIPAVLAYYGAYYKQGIEIEAKEIELRRFIPDHHTLSLSGYRIDKSGNVIFQRLTLVPLFMAGCGPKGSHMRWACSASLRTTPYKLNINPE